jgi:hypothetical protein
MPTLILSPRYTADSIALRAAALDRGWEVLRLPSWRPPEGLSAAGAVPYGEPLFCALVAEALGLALLEPPLDWLSKIPRALTSREVRFSSLGEARALEGPRFIKPADDKCFPAAVYPSGAALPAPGPLPEETPVLISEPVSFAAEYRCFVRDGRVRALSRYAVDGAPAPGEEAPGEEVDAAGAFAAAVLAGAPFPPAAALDVGRLSGGGFAVVEANPATSSGIYSCDPSAVLEVIARVAVPRGSLTAEDAAWINSRQ